MTFQDAKSEVEGRDKLQPQSRRAEAEAVLLAEIEALRGALEQVLATWLPPMHETREQFEANAKTRFNARAILERTKP